MTHLALYIYLLNMFHVLHVFVFIMENSNIHMPYIVIVLSTLSIYGMPKGNSG